jgi:Raf kinase inhibitor-like YbhB/YbcL family protein
VRRLAPLALLLVLLGAAACADDGRALRAPTPGATAPPGPGTTTAVGSGSGSGSTSGSDNPIIQSVPGLLLASSAFANGAAIPTAFTCDTPDAPSPPLAWTGVPQGTAEVAITVVDPDAGGFVHWFVAGISPSVRALGQGSVPDGAVQLVNGAGTAGWTPPCPPRGASAHRYIFTIYALSKASGLAASTPTADALAALSADASDVVSLAGTYQRP